MEQKLYTISKIIKTSANTNVIVMGFYFKSNINTRRWPILFSTEMVKAILEGKKTMTRRIVKPQPDDDGLWNDTLHPRSLQSNLKGWNGTVDATGESKEFKCPYGKVGNILWVRETWFNDADLNEKAIYVYKAGNENFPKGSSKWKPSIFMPKEACRLFLEVTSIKVERLQDISEADAIAEGIKTISLHNGDFYHYSRDYNHPDNWVSAENAFKELWQKINGERSWNQNPWVWVIEFKKMPNEK